MTTYSSTAPTATTRCARSAREHQRASPSRSWTGSCWPARRSTTRSTIDRSCLFGQGETVDDTDEKAEVLDALVEHLVPGRTADARSRAGRRVAQDARDPATDRRGISQDPHRWSDRRRGGSVAARSGRASFRCRYEPAHRSTPTTCATASTSPITRRTTRAERPTAWSKVPPSTAAVPREDLDPLAALLVTRMPKAIPRSGIKQA